MSSRHAQNRTNHAGYDTNRGTSYRSSIRRSGQSFDELAEPSQSNRAYRANRSRTRSNAPRDTFEDRFGREGSSRGRDTSRDRSFSRYGTDSPSFGDFASRDDRGFSDFGNTSARSRSYRADNTPARLGRQEGSLPFDGMDKVDAAASVFFDGVSASRSSGRALRGKASSTPTFTSRSSYRGSAPSEDRLASSGRFSADSSLFGGSSSSARRSNSDRLSGSRFSGNRSNSDRFATDDFSERHDFGSARRHNTDNARSAGSSSRRDFGNFSRLEFEDFSRRDSRESSRRDFDEPLRRDNAASPRAAVFDEQSLRDEEGSEQDAKQGLFSKLKSRKRAADKERAGRKYDREFADAPSSASTEPGPRAAVTRGEMGSSQRYAGRLQQNGSSSGGSFGGFSGISFGGSSRQSESDGGNTHAPRAKRMKYPVLKIGAAVLALVICAGAFMFPTVQSYYQTMREHDRLEAEYNAVNDRNTALQESIDDLQSDDGVAAYAHDEFGWIKSGEQTAVVTGLELSEKDSLDKVNASVQLSSIEAPETWYSPVLDKLFGVE